MLADASGRTFAPGEGRPFRAGHFGLSANGTTAAPAPRAGPWLCRLLLPTLPMSLPAAAGAGGAARHPAPRIVVIGASTGGTTVLRALVAALPRGCPGLVIAQHMPAALIVDLVAELAGLCAVEVRVAVDDDEVVPGRVLIAPPGKQTGLCCRDGVCRVVVRTGSPAGGHCPSVDELFASAALCLGSAVTGVILSGVGDDGAAGLRALQQAGAITIAQDEASCLVPDMPRAALRLGAVNHMVRPEHLAAEILRRSG